MYSQVDIIEAPTVPLVPLDAVRRHCRVDSYYDDDLLAGYFDTARQWAEVYLNRAIGVQTLRFSVTNSPAPTTTPYVPQSLVIFPLNWPPYIPSPLQLPRAPAIEILSIEQGPIGDLQPLPADKYVANLAVSPARVMIGTNFVPVLPQQSLSILFRAGWDNSLVPAPVKTAVLMLSAFLYESRGDTNAEEPAAAWRLLAPYRLWQFSAA